MQSPPPETERNFTRCPQPPQAHRPPRPPGETHRPVCARANTAASDPHLSPSAPDPFDTLPGFHTLRYHSEIQGSTNALGPSPAGSVPCLLPRPPQQACPPQPPRVSGRPAAPPRSRDTRPAGPRRPSSGSKPLPAPSASADFPATCNYSPGTLSPNTNRLSHRRCSPHPGGLAPAPLPRPQPLSPRGPRLPAAPAVSLPSPEPSSRSPPPHPRSPP